jgi:hypothetical protein
MDQIKHLVDDAHGRQHLAAKCRFVAGAMTDQGL